MQGQRGLLLSFEFLGGNALPRQFVLPSGQPCPPGMPLAARHVLLGGAVSYAVAVPDGRHGLAIAVVHDVHRSAWKRLLDLDDGSALPLLLRSGFLQVLFFACCWWKDD